MDFSLSGRWFLHVDMDAFFASVEELDHPEYRNKPLVVGADPENGSGRGVVSTCNYAARKFGIHSAMPVSKAYRLCPGAVFVKPRMGRYDEISKIIQNIFYEFSPSVECLSIDEAFLDISGMQNFYPGPGDLAFALKEKIKKTTGLTASAGISGVKFIAKMASDMNKPDGLTICPPGKEREFIADLPVGKLWGVGKKTEIILREMGIRTVDDLSRTEDSVLIFRLKNQGLHLKKLALGIDERTLSQGSPEKSMSEETTFSSDTDDKFQIEKTLKVLSSTLSQRMIKKGTAGRTVTLKIRLEDFSTFTRSKSFNSGIFSSAEIFNSAIRLYELFERGNKKIRLLGIALSHLSEEKDSCQPDLFSQKSDEKNENLDRVLNDMNKKFGSRVNKGIFFT